MPPLITSLLGYQESELVKLDILVNREPVDALSFIVHKDSAYGAWQKDVRKAEKGNSQTSV